MPVSTVTPAGTVSGLYDTVAVPVDTDAPAYVLPLWRVPTLMQRAAQAVAPIRVTLVVLATVQAVAVRTEISACGVDAGFVAAVGACPVTTQTIDPTPGHVTPPSVAVVFGYVSATIAPSSYVKVAGVTAPTVTINDAWVCVVASLVIATHPGVDVPPHKAPVGVPGVGLATLAL